MCIRCLFQVLDLPCVMESQKTIDNKTFYKTADVSQVSYYLLKGFWKEKPYDVTLCIFFNSLDFNLQRG